MTDIFSYTEFMKIAMSEICVKNQVSALLDVKVQIYVFSLSLKSMAIQNADV